MYKLGYENTDEKLEIEIYGIMFELPRITKELQNELQETVKDKQDLTVINKTIELLLGEGSIEKINEQRKKDNYKELDVMGALKIASFIQQTISKEMIKVQSNHTYEMRKNYDNYQSGYRKPYKRPYNNYRR